MIKKAFLTVTALASLTIANTYADNPKSASAADTNVIHSPEFTHPAPPHRPTDTHGRPIFNGIKTPPTAATGNRG